MFTDEQLRMILSMPDFGTEEDSLSRQYGMASQLRSMSLGQSGTGRMDWASQLSRAIGGLGSGIGQGRAMEAEKALGEERRKLLQQIFSGSQAGGI